VFDPTEHRLPGDCVQFAQSPQALTFDDYVRIYFSTRAVDPINGKYLSHGTFVDMTRDLRNIITVSEKPVIGLGDLGCFDEHGILPMNVLRHAGKVYGYTCSWSHRVSVSVETAIGLAISNDEGATFSRIDNGPVLAASLHEPCLVGFVKVINGVFHMWYIFGTEWQQYAKGKPPDRTCELPRWHSLGEGGSARGYRIGHAVSHDLRNWARDDDQCVLTPCADDWDSDMQCYPHVLECDGEIFLLYNGNEFGRYGFGATRLSR
jgi:hypothetical protein